MAKKRSVQKSRRTILATAKSSAARIQKTAVQAATAAATAAAEAAVETFMKSLRRESQVQRRRKGVSARSGHQRAKHRDERGAKAADIRAGYVQYADGAIAYFGVIAGMGMSECNFRL